MKTIRLETVDSTNTFAKRYLREHGLPSCEDGRLVVIAREQTAGRGRTGKTFSSLKDNGLYMTLVLPVGKRPEECLLLTPAAAEAVWEVLSEAGCRDLGIKWVNDILDRDLRKVCGILTEAVTDTASGIMTHAVIGVGVNVRTDLSRLPGPLQKIAGTVSTSCPPEELAGRIAERITACARDVLGAGRQRVLSAYEKHMILTGRMVTWEQNGKTLSGTVRGITPEAHLLVGTAEGIRELDSGMVSIAYRQDTKENV